MTDLELFLNKLEVALNTTYTDEQKALMSDFTKSRISFSSPGTGKTHTAIGGLIIAELFHRVPGNKIYALSFTRAATGSLKNRHLAVCEKLRISQTVNFSTLHSICTTIIKENYRHLGMNSMKITDNYDISDLADMIIASAQGWNLDITPKQARAVIRASRELNSALIFDPNHVKSKKCFMDCHMTYELFTKLRKLLYDYNKLAETIQVSDILLYTLEILLRFPEVSKKFKENCKIMLVDEFQDLSLLQLRIISLLSDTVIAIGDIKQQIYAFNGACQEIVEQYYKYYPNAERHDLTRSFRCYDEIAKYATQLILPNSVGGEDFTGCADGGVVEFKTQTDFEQIAEKLEYELVQNNHNFLKDKMFLFRNNFSATPLVEAFYKYHVPVRVQKYTRANQLPVVEDLCKAIMLAQNPEDYRFALILNIFVPEFQQYRKNEDNPLIKVAKKLGKSIFEVNYNFKDGMSGNAVMNALMEVHEALLRGETVRELFKILWPIYKDFWLEEHDYYYEMEPEYYTKLVAPLIVDKTFNKFISDETKKLEIIEDCNARRFGVRCYTFHGAKGLEADEIYIVDANSGIIPNLSQLDKLKRLGCDIDIAREIRNERSLVYVACTRAKEKLTIYSNAGDLSSLFTTTNEFVQYDKLYQNYHDNFSDVETFQEFYSS